MFCLDASAYTSAWRTWYRINLVPAYWQALENAASTGVAFSPRDVSLDLESQDEDLHGWAKQQNSLFVPLDDEQIETLKWVLKDHQYLEESSDANVVALAVVRQSKIVTDRRPTNRLRNIRTACSQIGISCIDIPTFFEELQNLT